MARPRIPFAAESEGTMLWPPEAHLVDDMAECYVEWRECAGAAADAYERWSEAPAEEVSLRFSAYTASLDREESAAISYELAVEDVERWLERTRR